MLRKNVCMMAALLVLGAAADAAAQTRCYIWRDGRRVECDRDRRDKERERERERERRRERERSRVVWGWGEPAQFGVRGGYDFEEDGGTAGAQLRIPLASILTFSPSADVFFSDTRTEWQINTDILLRPSALGGLYGGVGAGFINRDFDGDGENGTEAGLNLILGLESGRIRDTVLRPFAEGRWTTVDHYDAFRLVAGFNVPISGRR
jgi:hypothetical protein